MSEIPAFLWYKRFDLKLYSSVSWDSEDASCFLFKLSSFPNIQVLDVGLFLFQVLDWLPGCRFLRGKDLFLFFPFSFLLYF